MSWKMMTTEEVAERLGVSTARVRQFVGEGRLQADRSERSMLFEASDIEAFEAQRRDGRQVGKQGAQGRRDATGLFETAAEQRQPDRPKPAARVESAGRTENARLVAENRQLRRELEQVRSLADALFAGSESLGQVATALQQVLKSPGPGRSDRPQ